MHGRDVVLRIPAIPEGRGVLPPFTLCFLLLGFQVLATCVAQRRCEIYARAAAVEVIMIIIVLLHTLVIAQCTGLAIA
jgi:hypothetical protein